MFHWSSWFQFRGSVTRTFRGNQVLWESVVCSSRQRTSDRREDTGAVIISVHISNILSEREMVWFPVGSVLLWPGNRPESPSIIAVSFPVSSCSLVHKPLREKELHPPGSAETHIREETSEADRLLTWREWSEEFPTVSASYLTAQVRLTTTVFW